MYKKVECIVLSCDNCEKIYEDANDVSIWALRSDASDSAVEDGWYEENDKHYCPSCYFVLHIGQ